MTAKTPDPQTAYMAAWDALLRQVDSLHKLMHDPFKAPELAIYACRDLNTATWNAQVEYAAMELASKRKKDADAR